MYLGGYEDDELNAICPKHNCNKFYSRTIQRVIAKVKKYHEEVPSPKRSRTSYWVDIFEFIRLLNGNDDHRFRKVFEKCHNLLPLYLEAAEERASRGIFEEPLDPNAKRANEELGPEQGAPAEKRSRLETAEESLEANELTGKTNVIRSPVAPDLFRVEDAVFVEEDDTDGGDDDGPPRTSKRRLCRPGAYVKAAAEMEKQQLEMGHAPKPPRPLPAYCKFFSMTSLECIRCWFLGDFRQNILPLHTLTSSTLR